MAKYIFPLCSSIVLAHFRFQGKANSISAKGRPSGISYWLKNAQSHSAVPRIQDVGSWANSWRVWWTGLQPGSHKGDKLLRVVEPGEPWVEVKKGGINGFYTVVVSLGWWSGALKDKGDCNEFAKMLDDVLWVSDHMIGQGGSSAKRPLDEPEKNEAGVSKR